MAFNLADMVNKRPKQVQQENTSDTVYRDVFKLVPSKENFYGTDPDRLQGLKNSIQLFGVMQDVLIEDVNGEDHIISGHCRTMCCRMLVEEGHEEFRKINCKYTTVKDDTRKMFLEDGEEDHETTQLLEKLAVIQANRFREKTDWEKMKEALETEEIIKGLRELTELKGKTRDMVRETIGVSGTQMERYHAVQKKLSPEWMKEFQSAKINITVARELADLDETYQKKAMEHYEDHDGITGAEIKAFKSLQENNRDIPGQLTIEQATGQQRPPENDTPVQPELQIERLFEALNKGERERVLKCDTRMAAYLISIRYRDVRIRNGHFNYQANKEGITFNPDSTMQHSLTWNELSEELVKRFGKKQKPVKMVSIDAPERPEKNNSRKCIHRDGYNCTLSGAKKAAAGDGIICIGTCCWNCEDHSKCGYECNSSAHRPEEPEKSCFSETEAPDEKQQEDHSGDLTEMGRHLRNTDKIPDAWPEDLKDIPIPSLTAINDILDDAEQDLKDYLAIADEKLPAKTILKHQLIAGGLRIIKNLVEDCQEEPEEPEQPPLPIMRNNDQRKEWLRNYKAWGLWYTDNHTDVKYYKYDFNNGARLIVEEYTPDLGNKKSWWVSAVTESYYMHLVGGPEPDRAGGVPKWKYHTRYNKSPNSETELVEFLKEMQK